MTIAFVIYGELDERSGGFLYDSRLASVLEENGHRVIPVAQTEGCLLHKILQNGRPLQQQLSELKPDVVLIDELNHPSVFLSVKRLLRQGFRLVAVVHHLRCRERGSFLELRFFRWMERLTLRNMDGCIFNSKATADSVRALLENTAIPGITALPAADNPLLEARIDPDCARFLFLGNIIPRKGLHRLIRSLSAISSGEWSLDICGDEGLSPAYSARCRRMAADRIASGRIRFHGRLHPSALADLLRDCDIMAVPSDHEGFGIVYLEAMRAAMVPVASADGGASDMIRDGIDGYLVDPDDPGALDRILKDLVDSPGLRQALAEAARLRAGEFPGWNEAMSPAVDFLEGLSV